MIALSDPHLLASARNNHRCLLDATKRQLQAEYEQAILLLRAQEQRFHRVLGFASVTEYAQAEFDLSPRKVRALLRIGRSLGDFPVMAERFRLGELGWTKARELLGVMTPDTEAAWVERAHHASSRELEDLVATTVFGEGPPDEHDPRGSEPRRRFQVTVSQADHDMLTAALQLLKGQSGMSDDEFDPGAALAQMAQRYIHDADGADAPTAPRYQKVVETCPRCATSSGEGFAVTDAEASMADDDAQVVDMRPGPGKGGATRTIPPRVRRAVIARDRRSCVVPSCRNRIWLDLHHLTPRSQGGTHSEDNLVTLCSGHHRLLHEGHLAIARHGDQLRIERANGQRWTLPMTHVGRGPGLREPP